MQAAQPQQRKTEHSSSGERHRKRKNRTCHMRRKKRKQPRPEARRRAAHQRQSETPHRTQRKAGRMMQNGKIKKAAPASLNSIARRYP